MRRLTAHERALWARVAASVKPLPGRELPKMPAVPVAVVEPGPATKPAKAARMPSLSRPPAPPPKSKTPHPLGATLDGSWDRQITRGRLTPDRIVDLHGHTLATAHGVLASAILAADGARVILVITGKGRPDRPARIRDELMHWLDRPDLRPHVASLRGAHPRHGGGGAFYIILRRPK
ncbi:MAG: Smr/MutS family protein [Sandarakinorhabdus sp.]|jgi:DNA-nicking Smr family endonuclease